MKKDILTIPYVYEKDGKSERSFDIFSRVMKDRIVLINNEISDDNMSLAIAQLLYLDSISHDPIQMFIMSPGGSVHAGLGLIDIMNYVESPVYTYAIGYCASMGAAILSAGEKGHRSALPNAQIMVHQMAAGTEGKVHDMVVDGNYDKRLNNLLLATIAHNCGKLTDSEFERINSVIQLMVDDDESAVLNLPASVMKKLTDFKKSIDRDTWLMPLAAKNFGIIDNIKLKM